MKTVNAYPLLSERSRGWLKYLHRKVNTPDDWDRGGPYTGRFFGRRALR